MTPKTHNPKLGDDIVPPNAHAPVSDPPPATDPDPALNEAVVVDPEPTPVDLAKARVAAAKAEFDAAVVALEDAIHEASKPAPWDPAAPAILLEDGRVIPAPSL